MRMRTLSGVFALLTVSALPIFAAEPASTRSLSLQDCIQMAIEKNLELRIERYNPQLALFDLAAAQAGYEPSLNLSGQHDHEESGSQLITGGLLVPGSLSDADRYTGSLTGLTPWGMTYGLRAAATETTGKNFGFDTNLNQAIAFPFSNSRSTAAIDVVQPLLKNFWIDGNRLNIAVSKNRVQYSELGLKGRIIDIVTRVEQAYYDLEFGTENVKVQKKGLELAERLLAENRKRVEVGALAPLDEKQSEAAVAARQADVIAAQRTLDLLENILKQLINDNFAAWSSQSLRPSDNTPVERQLFSLQDSWTKGLSLRPDYLQAQLDLERSGLVLKYDRNQLYPQLDVFGSYGYTGTGDTFDEAFTALDDRDQRFYSYGGRLTIPLGNGQARNRYKSTKAGREQTVLALKMIEQDIMIQIDNAIKLAQSNFERLGASRKASEYAEAALAAEQKKLENGKSTSFIVLQLQRDLTAAQSDEISALVQYRRALASLAQAEGTTLDRRNIDLTVK